MNMNDVAGKNKGASKKNCWEHTNCGREPGGPRIKELGVCPVSTHQDLHGVHEGMNAGRACWVIAGSLCKGKVQGTYAQKLSGCWRCDFYNAVKTEEEPNGHGFSATLLGMQKVKEKVKR